MNGKGLTAWLLKKNPDENVNHLPSAASCVVDGINASGDSLDSNKRYEVIVYVLHEFDRIICLKIIGPCTKNEQRINSAHFQQHVYGALKPETIETVDGNASGNVNVTHVAENKAEKQHLNEILNIMDVNVVTNTRRSLPDIPSEQGTAVNWEPSGDNSSEHYATVGQYPNSVKRHTLPNGIESRPSISQHSSLSQADDTFSPYERVKYDKIKSKEHPYAQLQPTTSRPAVYNEEAPSTSEERMNLLRVDGVSSSNEPSAPSRSRRSSAHSNGGLNIPAASAVAGVLAASPELPYMTPPVTQANFSGDSQDSSKGYTSISVREPLANIIAQTKLLNKSKRELDPHYSTVSDDSDDVYTTIPDPNNPIYNSESETYARIPPLPITVEAEVNQVPSHSQNDVDETCDELYEPPPPSIKQTSGHNTQTQSHSRQEKRQANSPLPPPPSASSFDFHTDKVQVMKNLDDLYAKVHKNKREDISDKSSENGSDVPNSFGRTSLPIALEIQILDMKCLKNRTPPECDPNYEELRHRISNASDCADEPNYESMPSEIASEPNYAAVKSNGSESDPNYESVSQTDPNYESVKDLELPYERLDEDSTRTNSDLSGYEKSYEHDTSESSNSGGKSLSDKTEPPYEVLNNDIDSEVPGYEKIKNKCFVGSQSSGSSGIRLDQLLPNLLDEDGVFQV
ncbi:hypothetical protein NQ317_016564 [Molorchus minor]|uniref:Uncharacterized protein n=1 Tax=Molorchus minor TaxID=1323400 RepID=A0ABQ9J319_9CUCU|nr:hypothetical protein NQ317_016564 [Molorchus minor]